MKEMFKADTIDQYKAYKWFVNQIEPNFRANFKFHVVNDNAICVTDRLGKQLVIHYDLKSDSAHEYYPESEAEELELGDED